MRKLALALLSAGCLALLVGTVSISMTQLAYAQVEHPQDNRTFSECGTQGGAAICTALGQTGKVRFCHFNEGGDGSGRPHCGNASMYESHVAGIQERGHDKDFCITSAADEDACEKGEFPEK